jgi:hypothetical protein
MVMGVGAAKGVWGRYLPLEALSFVAVVSSVQ